MTKKSIFAPEMKPCLIINISKAPQLYFQLEKNDKVLDLSNTLKEIKKLILTDFINAEEVYPKALKLYKAFSEQLLTIPDLLDLKVNEFSVYWISLCAIKHPIHHWAKDFFLLLTILEHYNEKITQEYGKLTLLLPSHLAFITSTISELLKQQKYPFEPNFIFDKKPFYIPSKLAIVKALIKNGRNIETLKSNKEQVGGNAIYFHAPTKAVNKTTFLTNTQQLFSKNNHTLTVLPYFWSLTNKTDLSSNFLKHKPTIKQLFSLAWQVLKTYNQLTKLSLPTLMLGEKHSISTTFLIPELKQTLRRNLHLLIFHQWLTNYFSSIQQPTAIFFEDEFYEIGRIISAAAKKYPLVTTYGVQHGHFIEMHTVYSIYQAEIKKEIPIPDHFITWGNNYNQLFLSNNNLPSTYTLALGNPNYFGNKLVTTLPTKITTLLWCLTTKECMYIEWDIIKSTLQQGNYSLTIRLHPLKHITENEVAQLLGDFPFAFSHEQSITEAFKNYDLIISSAHSTTFLDALVNRKLCIRITSRFWNGNLTMDNDYLRTVKNTEEFNNAMQFFASTNSIVNANNNLLELNDEKWKTFIEEI